MLASHETRMQRFAAQFAYVTQPSATTQASLLEVAVYLYVVLVGILGFFMMYAANGIPLTARPAVP
jgi:hypothetical protein